ncbi:hypothetical protein D9758_018137 [Tetrapyrgos nigripes]|uniref:Uncharacterized protein n=1 Tax=Tetrapyrgos nigripes TaxID=182062 RepID=A0A8H5BV24_9AGAR|nr:hypothetical protein D9758_018137 [Tetrapyrgos nigripes]
MLTYPSTTVPLKPHPFSNLQVVPSLAVHWPPAVIPVSPPSLVLSVTSPSVHSNVSSPSPPPSAKNEAARALLAKNFSASSRTSKTPAKSASRNSKLELMKIRQRAIAADPKLQKSTIPPSNAPLLESK